MKSKILRIVVLSLALLLLFGSCTAQGGGNDTTAPAETEPEVTLPVETILEVVSDGKCAYKIIFPQDSDPDYIKAAEKVGEAIKNATGVRPDSGGDFLLPGKTPQEKEILIGPTNRAESQTVFEELRSGEYAIRAVGSKIVICGTNASSTLSAAYKFISEGMKDAAAGEFLYSSKNDYAKKNTYRIESCTVGGTPLAEYAVTYVGAGTAQYAAVTLADFLSRASGNKIKPEAAGTESAAHSIEFSVNSSVPAGQFRITVEAGQMKVTAADYAGLIDAEAELEKTVFSSKEKTIDLAAGETFTGTTTVNVAALSKKNSGEIRVMYHNVWGYQADYPMLNRADMALDVYTAYAPDVLCFEEAGNLYRAGASAVYAYFRANKYVEICFSSNGGTGNPIYFNSSVLRLIDSGYARERTGDKGTTWAVFERKSDGKRFAVTNSHFAANSNAGGDAALGDQYRLQDAQCAANVVKTIRNQYPGISVIIGGDCNTAKGSAAYRAITDIGAVNVRDKFTGGWNVLSAFHGNFDYDASLGIYKLQTALKYSGTSAIDHIFILGSIAPTNWNIVTDYTALTCADHAPHFLDFTP